MVRAAIVRTSTLLFVAALACALGAEDKPHFGPSMAIDGTKSVAILLAVSDSLSPRAALSKWSGRIAASGDEMPPVWVLCFGNTSTEAVVRDLPPLLPFVVEAGSSWTAVLESFQLRVSVHLAACCDGPTRTAGVVLYYHSAVWIFIYFYTVLLVVSEMSGQCRT